MFQIEQLQQIAAIQTEWSKSSACMETSLFVMEILALVQLKLTFFLVLIWYKYMYAYSF